MHAAQQDWIALQCDISEGGIGIERVSACTRFLNRGIDWQQNNLRVALFDKLHQDSESISKGRAAAHKHTTFNLTMCSAMRGRNTQPLFRRKKKVVAFINFAIDLIWLFHTSLKLIIIRFQLWPFHMIYTMHYGFEVGVQNAWPSQARANLGNLPQQ